VQGFTLRQVEMESASRAESCSAADGTRRRVPRARQSIAAMGLDGS